MQIEYMRRTRNLKMYFEPLNGSDNMGGLIGDGK